MTQEESQRETALPYEPKPQFRYLAADAATSDCRGKRIGILVITYNALTTLRSVLKRIPAAVWQNVEEVVVFDDASPDATFELAVGIKMLLDLPKLTVLRHPRNLGYGGNQKAGYRYFMEKGFDICVLLHGDGQYAPEMLGHMYAPLVRGEADAVFGSRMKNDFGGPLKGGMPVYKFVGNKILTAYENAALGMRLTEFHSGYRAYNLHALRQIDFSRMTDGFHFDTEIIIKLRHQNFAIREIPIPTYYGKELCYVNGLRYAADVFRAVRRYQRTVRSVERCLEFEEYFVHYPIKESRHSSHDLVLRSLGSGKDILDVGCGEGFLADKLKERGHRVTGVDSLPAPSCQSVMAEYASADLDSAAAVRFFESRRGRFDYVLLLDVLEHLKNAERVLRTVQQSLKPGGRVVISLPNVANVTVRFSLLFGRFEYAERGILDRTHLRFYTRRAVRDLLDRCGLRSVKEEPTVMPVELVLGLSPRSWLLRVINSVLALATRLMPGLLAYQIVHVAVPEPNVLRDTAEAHESESGPLGLERLAEHVCEANPHEVTRG